MGVSVTELSLWSHRINVIVKKAQEGRLITVRVTRNHSEGHVVFEGTQSHCGDRHTKSLGISQRVIVKVTENTKPLCGHIESLQWHRSHYEGMRCHCEDGTKSL